MERTCEKKVRLSFARDSKISELLNIHLLRCGVGQVPPLLNFADSRIRLSYDQNINLFCTFSRLNHPVKKFKAAEPKPEPSDRPRKLISSYNFNGMAFSARNLSSPPESICVKQEPSDLVLFSFIN